MKQGKEEEAESKSNGGKKSKGKGGMKSKGKTQNRSKARKASKCVSARKNKTKETWAESTDKLEATRRLTEVQTGRGSAGLVRG